MINKSAFAVPLSIALTLLILGTGCTNRKTNLRTAHENFLLKAGKDLKKDLGEESEENVRADRPDEAAFTEFIKTMDPGTRLVPVERRFAALDQAREMMALKSGGPGLKWASQVADMGGRTRALMFDPNDPNGMAMFAGSATGGLWYSENPMEGMDWMPVNDFWPGLAISSLSYDPQNTQILYMGTGESETALITYRESSGHGNGLYASHDGGKSWSALPSTSEWAYVTDVDVRVENGVSVLYAGVVSSYYKGIVHRTAPTDGLYRSTDQGASWRQVLPNIPGTSTPFAPSDICFSADKSRIFVGTTYGINSSVTDSDRSGAACILTSDDGLNWTVNRTYQEAILAKTSVNFPGRIMITEAPSDPNILYAIVASGYPAGAFYGYGCEYLLKTTDKGVTWTPINFPPTFASLAWHAFSISINPQNPNVIWLGGLDTYRSLDGGANWTIMSYWSLAAGAGFSKFVHADIHHILQNPRDGRNLFIATDGGVFVTGSSLSPDNVTFLEINQNYNTLQYYACALSPVKGDLQIMGGLQDNGTLHYKPGIRPTKLDKLSGGDGAFCFFDSDNPDWLLTSSQYSTLNLYLKRTGQRPVLWNAARTGLGIFINPMDYDSGNNRLFANVSYFDGSTANQLAVINMAENQITGFLRNIGSHTQVPFTAVKWMNSGVEGGTLFLGTAAGQVYRLDKPHLDSTAVDITGTNFPVGYVSSVETGQTADTLVVTLSNYGIPSVFMTTDAGNSWKNIEGNLPDMPIRYAILHPQSAREVMVATETGIWTTANSLAADVKWTPQVTGMANVRVDMLKVRPSDLIVVAASHGRGMFTTEWKLQGTSGTEPVLAEADLLVYPNPSSGEFRIETTLKNQGLLTIRDIQGRVVRSQQLQPGQIRQVMDLRKEGKGTYFIRIESAGQTITKQLIVR